MRRNYNSVDEGRKEIKDIYESLTEPMQLHILSIAHLLLTTQKLVLKSENR